MCLKVVWVIESDICFKGVKIKYYRKLEDGNIVFRRGRILEDE